MGIDRDAALKQAEKLLRLGRLDGAIAEYVRLVEDQPGDWNAINALGDLYVRAGDADRAVSQFTRVAEFLFAEGFLPRAAALYKKILKVAGDHEPALLRLGEIAARQGLLLDARMYFRQVAQQRRGRGDERGVAEILARLDPRDARAFLTLDSAGSDPDLLLALAGMLAREGGDPRTALVRLLAVAPERQAEVEALWRELAASGQIDAAYACVDVLSDAALLDGDFPRAVRALEALLGHGEHVAARAKLGRIQGDLPAEAGRHTDRAAAEAGSHTALPPEGGSHTGLPPEAGSHTGLPPEGGSHTGLPPEGGSHTDPPRVASGFGRKGPDDDAFVLDPVEIDLTDVVGGLAGGDRAPQDLDEVFEAMRSRAGGDQEGARQYERGLERLLDGRVEEAVHDLTAAAKMPVFRFAASAQLGRLYAERSDLQAAVEWLERAAEAPAPTGEDGFAVLYDLAAALERLGESARALAVLIELQADAGAYRDVPQRVEQLSRAEAGSRRV